MKLAKGCNEAVLKFATGMDENATISDGPRHATSLVVEAFDG